MKLVYRLIPVLIGCFLVAVDSVIDSHFIFWLFLQALCTKYRKEVDVFFF